MKPFHTLEFRSLLILWIVSDRIGGRTQRLMFCLCTNIVFRPIAECRHLTLHRTPCRTFPVLCIVVHPSWLDISTNSMHIGTACPGVINEIAFHRHLLFRWVRKYVEDTLANILQHFFFGSLSFSYLPVFRHLFLQRTASGESLFALQNEFQNFGHTS